MSTERIAPTAVGEVLVPALLALFMTLAATPLWYLLFSGSTERGIEVPWPGALSLFALAAYGMARVVGVAEQNLYLSAHLLAWLAGLTIWTLLEPAYGPTNELGVVTLGGVLRTLVLVWWSALAWWVGIRYATHLSFLRPGAVRMMTAWGWRVLIGGSVVAALFRSDGSRALEQAMWVVPAAMLTWVALIALGEIHRSGLDLRHKVGSVSPLRHWLSALGFTVIAVVGMSAGAAVLLPSVAGGLGATAVGRGITRVLNAVYRILAPVVILIGNFVLDLFNNPEAVPSVNFGEDGSAQIGAEGMPTTGDTTSMVWIVVAVVTVALVFFVLVWARRRVSTVIVEGSEIDRVNLFDTELIGEQVRSAFSRRPRKRKRRRTRIDLNRPPANVREAWSHLETLAANQGAERDPVTTVRDYATGLTDRWPAAGPDITRLSRLYERVQYGDEPGNDPAAIGAWQAIKPVLVSPPGGGSTGEAGEGGGFPTP